MIVESADTMSFFRNLPGLLKRLLSEMTQYQLFPREDRASVDARLAVGGSSAVSPLVEAFLKHVHDLADIPSPSYHIYQHDDDD